MFESDTRRKCRTQRATKRDGGRPSNNSCFRIFSVQSRREPMSPKRNLNLKPETSHTIFAPTIFTKLFNDKKKEEEVFVCCPWCVTRRVELTSILAGFISAYKAIEISVNLSICYWRWSFLQSTWVLTFLRL